jgi:hypothetical protein
MVGSQIPNLTFALSFYHKSCKLGLNEQCKCILNSYVSKPFQWYHERPNLVFFSFPTKVLNICDSHTSATLKEGVHLKVIRLHPLDSPPFVRMCFTPKHIILASWTLALHTQS